MAVTSSRDPAPGDVTGQVLLVEDDAPTRRMLSVALRSLGFRVFPVTDAETAYEALDARIPDLIVVDVRLPRVSGIEFTETVRERPGTGTVPILLLSAYERPPDHRADRFLPKPFELSHFERLVEELAATA